MTAETLARPEIRNLEAYSADMQESGTVRLNANEAPWAVQEDGYSSPLNRYPEIRPLLLQENLARHYGVTPGSLLATRGSSEAIDLLVRAFCRPGVDNVVVTPPTFLLYRVYADIQGAEVIPAPLLAGNDFELDNDVVLEACTAETKLIFVCSPNNPTGGLVPRSQLIALADARKGKSLIVVDEAYIEFSEAESVTALAGEYDNLVVLRTLSKALALAGARCGAVVGSESLIRMLNGILAPYALATPVIDCVLDALTPEKMRLSQEACDRVVRERERLSQTLAGHRRTVKVWPSRANFLLVQFDDLATVRKSLQAKRILIREFDGQTGLANCARITVGTRTENDLLLEALGA